MRSICGVLTAVALLVTDASAQTRTPVHLLDWVDAKGSDSSYIDALRARLARLTDFFVRVTSPDIARDAKHWWRAALSPSMCVIRRHLVLALALGASSLGAQEPPSPSMTFFVTSRGRGFGADLAGLAGADSHCQQLAMAVGRGSHVWRAYLSVPATNGRAAVNARDRIGSGPWANARGLQIAASIADLHGGESIIGRDTALSEKGTTIAPGRHDILTGSSPDGTLSTEADDTTCHGWTSHDAGAAMLGHVNRTGGGTRPTSWNSAHLSRGCSQSALRASMGDALFYCFAAD